jgi:uncharacterized membrane protein
MTKKNQEQDNALDELKIRYVKGEINEDEFLSKKKVLEEK